MMEQGHELVALTQGPWQQRPFYHMKEVVGSQQLTRSFELICRGVEIATGAIREHRHETLMAQLAEKGLTGKGMEFYLESFKLGGRLHTVDSVWACRAWSCSSLDCLASKKRPSFTAGPAGLRRK